MILKVRFTLYAGTYLVLKKDNRILLLRRSNTGYRDGWYSLVGGHLDGRETAKNCMIREVKEEIGVDLDVQSLKVACAVHQLRPDREEVGFYLIADKWDGEIKIMEPEKCDDLSWFDLNKFTSQHRAGSKICA